MNHRPINEIAAEIRADWVPIHGTAKPYVDAMATLHSIDDKCGADSAVDALSYFLGACGTWKGAVARRVKTEIRGILAMHDGEVARRKKIA